MLSIQTTLYNINYEADEIHSSSSSSLSFENNESSSLYNNNHYNHYQDTSLHTASMSDQSQQHQQQQHPEQTFHNNSDWLNKSPQPSFIHYRDDLCSPVDNNSNSTTAANPSYSSYDNNYDSSTNNSQQFTVPTATPTMSNNFTMQHGPTTIYNSLHWTSNNNEVSTTNNIIVGTSSSPTSKLEHHHHPSPDFFLPSKKQQQFNGNSIMSMFPLPPPPPQPSHHNHHRQSTMNNMFCQRPGYASPIISKGERYHPRFKSANARLSPFTEQQELYQNMLSTSTSSSPPQHYHPLMEGQLAVNESENDGNERESLDMQHQKRFFHNYQSTKKELVDNNVLNDQTQFQFNVVLHASTAVKKKHDEQPVTYLNRGQAYLIDLNANTNSQQQYPSGTMTSTISIAFHESSHRQIAENYWKYWISQQEIPKEARAIGLDTNQTTGIYNIRLESFDRVSFDWNGRFGAKVYVRFNCLSTDFSRIKGVKGIPLRCVIETRANYMSLPDNSIMYKGTFQKEHELFQYKETCYCKIKLFRDKGAERKNKDDKKQMAKQMEKVIVSTNGNPQQHPLWPVISQPHRSTSVLLEVPSSPDITLDDFDEITSSNQLFNIMAPLPVTASSPNHTQLSTTSSTTTKRKRLNDSTKASKKGEGRKAARNNLDSKKSPVTTNSSPALSFYVWTRHVHSTPHEICLEQLTTYDLRMKLGEVLTIHPARISEILWRRKKSNEQHEVATHSSDVLVLVEDTFIAEHIVDGEMMTVDLEIKADGNLRLVLEF